MNNQSDQIFADSGPPVWKRLINRPRFTRECIPLIMTILSTRSTAVAEMVDSLREDDAQTFIDKVAEVTAYALSP